MDINFDLRDLFSVLYKHIKLILFIIFSIVGVTAIISYFVITPVYEAKTDLIVTNKQVTTDRLPSLGNIESNLKLVDTYRVIIESPTVLKPAIEATNSRIEVSELKEKMNVKIIGNSQVLSIIVEDKNRQFAVNMANSIANEFIKKASEVMNFNNVYILSPATMNEETKPLYPKPKINLIISFFLSIFFAVGFVLLKEFFNTSIPDEQAVKEHLNLPVLGVIPLINKSINERDSLSTSGDELNDKLILQMTHGKEIEAYQNLAASIYFLQRKQTLNTILFTSPNPGEGKSLTSANIAILFAKSSKRTVYVDLDLRKPSGHHAFQLTNKKGVTSVLHGDAEVSEIIQACPIENLSIITSGPIPPYSVGLLEIEEIDKLLNELKEQFEMIIVDCPPIFVSDTSQITTLADGCVIVIDAQKTRYPIAQKEIEKLSTANANILGVVLNNSRNETTSYYYY
ncbi:polysaccharide biosynthesis tyrosine autokinase [Bacillaceae bacterium W0354]